VSGSREDPRALIRYGLVVAAVAVAGAWSLYLAREAFLLVYLSAVVAIGLGRHVTSIERSALFGGRVRFKRWQAILVLYVLVITLLVGIVMLIVPALVEQARELSQSAPDLLHRAQQYLIHLGVINRELSVREAFQQTPVGSTDVFGTLFGAVAGVVGTLFGVVTILILAFYLLLESDDLVRIFVRLFPRDERPRVADACQRVSTKVSAWLAGQVLLAAIIATTSAIGLFLLGIPYFYVLALIAGIGELIPIIGPFIGALPGIAVALSVSPALALGVTVFYLVQQQLESHVLVPRVMSRRVGVSPIVVIVALLIGGSLLGVLGAIIAIPTAAILQVVFEELTVDSSLP
jgi:predicted PurR-regulated permease PerM